MGDQPLYVQGQVVSNQYIAIPWKIPLDKNELKYYVAQVLFAEGKGKSHVFVIRYQRRYLNFPNGWELENPLDGEDLSILNGRAKLVPTGREAVYKGLVFPQEKVLSINMTPMQMHIYNELIEKCCIVRSWCPLGSEVPVGAPVVVKRSTSHGGHKSKGVFASEVITGKTIVGEYRGVVKALIATHLFEENVSRYVLDAGPMSSGFHYFIISNKSQDSAWTRYINRPNANEVPNVVFETYKVSIDHPEVKEEFIVLVKTLKRISKGEQLLVSYECKQHQ